MPCVEQFADRRHVWSSKRDEGSAVLDSAYRPDPNRKSTDHMRRTPLKKKTTRLVQEGEYIAEVEVELETTDDPWSPYLTLVDAE